MWSHVFNSSRYLRAAEDLRHNVGQWQIYNSTGNCVIQAGPGSGKTKTLITKLARMLAEDVLEPRGIACITYNNECARELESRMEQLGIGHCKRVFIGTVHSFSLTQILLPYRNLIDVGLPDNFSVANNKQCQNAVEDAYRTAINGPDNPQWLKNDISKYRRTIANDDSIIYNGTDIAKLSDAYEKIIHDKGLIDFDDMPILALKALRSYAWLKKSIWAKYPILLVDEYQDLGPVLHNIVLKLCFDADTSTNIRLLAVGDIDQSIYGFTGAAPETLQELSQKDNVSCINLKFNYRCGRRIVEASKHALGEERNYEASPRNGEGIIYFHPLNHDKQEQANFIICNILPEIRRRNQNIVFGDIGVLYQSAKLGDYITRAAQSAGIKTLRSDGNSLYSRNSRIMRWLELCAGWCVNGWKSGNPSFRSILKDARRLFWEINQDEYTQLFLQQKLIDALWNNRKQDMDFIIWIENFKSQFLDEMLSSATMLSDEIEHLDNFISKLKNLENGNMTLDEFSGLAFSSNNLRLSTLHSSKGREFTIVIMYHIDYGVITYKKNTRSQLIESKRLFYVGLTRAKKEVHIVYSEDNPSPFITDLKNKMTGAIA